jgi:oligopeptide/dipeptide ABC transporter ATP-binding protein
MYAGQIVEQGEAKTILEHPRHPYSQALLRSSLLNATEHGRLYAIPGGPPPPGFKLVGCRFRPRCHVADEAHVAHFCEHVEPQLVACEQGHAARCWAVDHESEPVAG